jgi:hypothetical protein
MTWETIERLSYFGKKRDAIQSQFDSKYGVGNWRIAWQFGSQALPFPIAIQIYEDAYYEYLSFDKGLLEQLLQEAREVYDNAESNVNCGLDYSIQENNSNHYQDISVRRVILRLGRTFKGNNLVQIRHQSESEVGALLSPGRVRFHLPDLIVKPVQEGWWGKSTVEEFWQSNKILQIKKESSTL